MAAGRQSATVQSLDSQCGRRSASGIVLQSNRNMAWPLRSPFAQHCMQSVPPTGVTYNAGPELTPPIPCRRLGGLIRSLHLVVK